MTDEPPRKPDWFRSVRPLPGPRNEPVMPRDPDAKPARVITPAPPLAPRKDGDVGSDEHWQGSFPWPPSMAVAFRKDYSHRRPTVAGDAYLAACAKACRGHIVEIMGPTHVIIALHPPLHVGATPTRLLAHAEVALWALGKIGIIEPDLIRRFETIMYGAWQAGHADIEVRK